MCTVTLSAMSVLFLRSCARLPQAQHQPMKGPLSLHRVITGVRDTLAHACPRLCVTWTGPLSTLTWKRWNLLSEHGNAKTKHCSYVPNKAYQATGLQFVRSNSDNCGTYPIQTTSGCAGIICEVVQSMASMVGKTDEVHQQSDVGTVEDPVGHTDLLRHVGHEPKFSSFDKNQRAMHCSWKVCPHSSTATWGRDESKDCRVRRGCVSVINPPTNWSFQYSQKKLGRQEHRQRNQTHRDTSI